jgi:hypothetical protein
VFLFGCVVNLGWLVICWSCWGWLVYYFTAIVIAQVVRIIKWNKADQFDGRIFGPNQFVGLVLAKEDKLISI